MRFLRPAPGHLTEEAGVFYMDWAISPGAHFGYSNAFVEAQVSSVLNDARGWEQAGIVARQVAAADCQVMFQVVEEAVGESGEAARTFWDESPVLVQLEYAWLENPDSGWATLVNHEAAHAFFWATHEGAPGIMTGDAVSNPDWPNAEDIQSVIDWLVSASSGAFWFPGDIAHYFTRWLLELESEARLFTTVLGGVEGSSIRGVWGRSYDAMIEGRFETLTVEIPTESRGFYVADWLPFSSTLLAESEITVGIVVEGVSAETLSPTPVIGLAEVQIR